MLKVNSTSISADSIVTVNGESVVVVNLNATLAADGTMSSSQFVQDTQLYKDNYDAVAEDVEAFNLYVRDKLGSALTTNQNTTDTNEEVS